MYKLYLNCCFVPLLAWLVILVELVYSREYGVMVLAPYHYIITTAKFLVLCCCSQTSLSIQSVHSVCWFPSCCLLTPLMRSEVQMFLL